MRVKQLITELKKQSPELNVELFAHDHNPECADEGTGGANSVFEIMRKDGTKIVAIQS